MCEEKIKIKTVPTIWHHREAYKPTKTLQNILSKPKKNPAAPEEKGVIYNPQCKDYVGQISRRLAELIQ